MRVSTTLYHRHFGFVSHIPDRSPRTTGCLTLLPLSRDWTLTARSRRRDGRRRGSCKGWLQVLARQPNGGGRGIRTPWGLAAPAVFKLGWAMSAIARVRPGEFTAPGPSSAFNREGALPAGRGRCQPRCHPREQVRLAEPRDLPGGAGKSQREQM